MDWMDSQLSNIIIIGDGGGGGGGGDGESCSTIIINSTKRRRKQKFGIKSNSNLIIIVHFINRFINGINSIDHQLTTVSVVVCNVHLLIFQLHSNWIYILHIYDVSGV